jgi:hypothetical protein
MIVYTKSNARQRFAEMMKKVKFSGELVGVGKGSEEIEVLLFPSPAGFDEAGEWVICKKSDIGNATPDVEELLYVLYRLIQQRHGSLLDGWEG